MESDRLSHLQSKAIAIELVYRWLNNGLPNESVSTVRQRTLV